MLEAIDVTVARGRRVLTTAFSLRVGGGDLVHVVGPNGCGKSSLLRVLAGVVEPRRGSVRHAAGCSYVPERVALPGALTGRRWLHLVGAAGATLPDELSARAGRLSQGQLQRLVLIGALDARGAPGLAVLDEPWAGLDADARQDLGAALAAFARRGGAVVFTDHSGAASIAATRSVSIGMAA